jgi:hypothetical protein
LRALGIAPHRTSARASSPPRIPVASYMPQLWGRTATFQVKSRLTHNWKVVNVKVRKKTTW